jgi:oligosaccharyltransferase complex subunit gamma
MRVLSILASASALVASVFAAELSSEERFVKFNRLSRLSTPLLLNDLSYKTLTSAPRDYSVAIVLTAQDARFGCQLCREFKPEWELIAQSWARGDKRQESRLFFGVLDFAEGRDTFLSVRSPPKEKQILRERESGLTRYRLYSLVFKQLPS